MSKYTIEITGYGGEYVVGNVTKKSYDFFTENDINVDDYISDWDGDLNIPEDCQPFPSDGWFECDDIAHEYGAELSEDSYISVFNDNDEEIWSSSLDLESDECVFQSYCLKHVDTQNISHGQFIFYGHSYENGSFFHAELETNKEFDPKLLKFSFVIIDDIPIFNGLSYNGSTLDNDGMTGTSGQSNSFELKGIN